MNMKKYDVVIVGGSCAGAAAGYTLAKAGVNTAIVDKAIFPRKKLCGGVITEKTIRLLGQVYGNISIEMIIDSSCNTLGIYHAASGKICKYSHPTRKMHFIDRTIFDNFFLEKAGSAGCVVLTGQEVIKVKDNSIIVGSGEEIFADFIVGADGANSIVRKSLSSDIRKKHYAIALEVDVDYKHLKCFDDKDGIFLKMYFGFVNFGYGWVFPKKDFVTVGLEGLVYSNTESIRDLFVTFLKFTSKGDVSSLIQNIAGFPTPFHNLIKKPGRKNIFLVGDAAGLIEPITGEGIYFAILSGKLTSEAILAGGNCISNYNYLIKKNIHKLLNQAYCMKRFFFHSKGLPYVMFKMKHNAKYCRYYFDLLSGEIDYIQYIKTVLKDRNKYSSE